MCQRLGKYGEFPAQIVTTLGGAVGVLASPCTVACVQARPTMTAGRVERCNATLTTPGTGTMRDDPGRCPQASEEENRAKDEQRTRKLLRQRKRKDEHAEITEQDLDLAFHHLPGDLALLDALALLGHRQHCEDVGVFGGVEHAGDQQRRGRDIDDGRNVVLKRLAGDPPLQDQRKRDEEGGR
jgi:hypothetical protein